MNSSRKLFTPLICPFLGLIFLFQSTFGGAHKERPARIALFEWKQFDVNNISCTIANDGAFADYRKTGGSGLEWPKGSGKTAVFTAGIFIVGKEGRTGDLRAAVANFYTDFQAGIIEEIYRGDVAVAAEKSDPRFRIYKIEREDTVGGINPDYDEWPVEHGAPVDHQGRPEFFGDQQLFMVYNDLDTLARRQTSTSPPMGLEVRALFWGYNSIPYLKDVMFARWEIINKSMFTYDSTYVTLWSDVDLGDASDDQTGCDTTLNLGFFYNDDDLDGLGSYYGYGDRPPAVGFLLLDGARSDRGSILPMTSFIANLKNVSGGRFDDLPLGNSTFPRGAFNYARGLDAFGNPIIDPVTGEVTRFMFPGDPVLGTGWLPQHSNIRGSDKRLHLNSGPFTFAPLDTQVVVGAVIVAQGGDRLASVSKLRSVAQNVQSFIAGQQVEFFVAEPTIAVVFESRSQSRVDILLETVNVKQATAQFYRRDNVFQGSVELLDDGHHGDVEAGDGIFGNTFFTSPSRIPLRMDLRLELLNNDTVDYPSAIGKITTLGPIIASGFEVISDHVNEDRIINPGEWAELRFSITNPTADDLDSVLISPLSAEHGSAGARILVNTLPSDSTVIPPGTLGLIVYKDAPLNIPLALVLFILDQRFNNHWTDTLYYVVEPFTFQPIESFAAHIQGTSTGTFGVSLVDPQGWKDHEYRILIPEQEKFTLVDQTTGETLLSRHEFPYGPPTNIPVTDGFKITRGSIHHSDGDISGVFEVMGAGGVPISPARNVFQESNSSDEWAIVNSPPRFPYADYLNAGEYNSLGRSNFEIRFTETGSEYYTGNEQFSLLQKARYRVPFEIWDIGETPDDAGDDKRLSVRILDLDSNGVWTIARDSTQSEPIFSTVIPPYVEPLPDPAPIASRDQFRIGNLVFYQGPAQRFAPPALGTVIRVLVSRTPTDKDVYAFNPVQLTPAEPEHEIPQTFALFQNYPNPFNPTTNIRYELPQQSHVRLFIFNILGQQVATLVDEVQQAGRYTVAWNGISNLGRAASSGVYFYLLQAGDFIQTRKMLHIK